nr:hypothetical protein [Bacillota bacterium]
AILVNTFDKHSMNGWIALSPFVALIVFLLLGFWQNMWHPAWLVFFVVPILAITSSFKTMRFVSYLTAIMPFVATITFVLVGTYAGLWNPIWLVFLTIPMISVLHENKFWKVLLLEASFLIAIAAYLVSGYVYGDWGYGLFAFFIPIGVSLILSEDSFLVINRMNKNIWLLAAAMTIIYIGSGLLFETTWPYLWMIFLLIPVYAILTHGPKKDKLIACMPFISTVLFFSLGYFFGWWAFSWIAFLLIPMVAIIKHA